MDPLCLQEHLWLRKFSVLYIFLLKWFKGAFSLRYMWIYFTVGFFWCAQSPSRTVVINRSHLGVDSIFYCLIPWSRPLSPWLFTLLVYHHCFFSWQCVFFKLTQQCWPFDSVIHVYVHRDDSAASVGCIFLSSVDELGGITFFLQEIKIYWLIWFFLCCIRADTPNTNHVGSVSSLDPFIFITLWLNFLA